MLVFRILYFLQYSRKTYPKTRVDVLLKSGISSFYSRISFDADVKRRILSIARFLEIYFLVYAVVIAMICSRISLDASLNRILSTFKILRFQGFQYHPGVDAIL